MTRLSLALVLGGVIAAGCCAAAPASAQIEFGAHAGTAGIGPDALVKLNDNFSLRGAGDWLNFSYGRTYDGIDYSGRLKLMTGGAFLNWSPWANALFFSGGAYFGDRGVDISARPVNAVTLGGQTFTALEAGELSGRIKMSSVAPFAGVGFDSGNGPDRRGLGINGVLGVAFSGRPSVTLASSGGTLSATPTLQSALAEEEGKIANQAGILQYYPVAQLGLNYRF